MNKQLIYIFCEALVVFTLTHSFPHSLSSINLFDYNLFHCISDGMLNKQHQNLISDIDEDVDTLLQMIKSSYNRHNEFFYLNQTHPNIVHTSISSKFLVKK